MTMITKSVTISPEIGRTSQKAAVPAASSVNMISSVAYATEERLSLENVDNAFPLGEAFLDFLLRRQGPSEHEAPQASGQPLERAGRRSGRGLRRQHACIAIAEVLGMGPRHSDSAVPRPVAWPGCYARLGRLGVTVLIAGHSSGRLTP